jgi:hypothetical protein
LGQANRPPSPSADMSQNFDYFVCSRPMIERWADAPERGDEDLQQAIQAEMPRFLSLKDVGQTEYNILARCVDGDDGDVVEAVGEVDLVKAVNEAEGPWIMAFRQPAVEAITRMVVDQSLLERWVKAVAEFSGSDEDRCRETLTADVAQSLRDLCALAVGERLGVFTCFYG